MHEALAGQSILTRHFEVVPSLRFGLPATIGDLQRLDAALGSAKLREVQA
jgi:cobalamin biosynthetic protein CobC